MTALDALRSAVEALRANLTRSLLTMLGVVIGVAAVILVVSIGDGARQVVVNQIQSLGSNLLIIDASDVASGETGSTMARLPTASDAEAIEREIPGVEMAVPQVHGTVLAVRGDLNRQLLIQGVTPDFLTARDWSLTRGRNFTAEEADAGAKVVLLGATAARALFGDADPIGQAIRVKSTPLTVIGVLSPKGQTTSGKDQDDVIVAPLKTATNRVLGSSVGNPERVDTVFVKVAESEDMAAVERSVRDLLRDRHRLTDAAAGTLSIKNLAEVRQIKEGAARALADLVAAIAGVSLLVGGIGIMNIMLVSVIERTREIGVRMAVGARRLDVLAQFLVEAVVLSATGGTAGLILGIIAAGAIASAAHWPWIISPAAVVLAVGFSVAVGIIFGFYPARRAAMLNPIEALRHD